MFGKIASAITIALFAAFVILFSMLPAAFAVEATEQFNWAEINPVYFLNLLRSRSGFVVIKASNFPPLGWITRQHVGILMKFIDTAEPAAVAVSELCKEVPGTASTIGNEAMFLIEGFRKGIYPPGVCSVCGFKADALEYRKWWEEQGEEAGKGSQVGAFKVTSAPAKGNILDDTKPALLSIADALIYRKVVARVFSTSATFLVNRLTNNVSYVWHYGYKLFVRPEYVMPGAQQFYARSRK